MADKPSNNPTLVIALTRSRGGRWFANMSVGAKLTLGFSVLIMLTLLIIGLSFLSSNRTTQNINRTNEVSAPLALTSAKAQSDLLTMLSDVRGYLALGDAEYRTGYSTASAAFEADLIELERLLNQNANDADTAEAQKNLDALQATYAEWSPYPDQLFALRDDQYKREPAFSMLMLEASPLMDIILVNTGAMIDTQKHREPTLENMELLSDLADFQASFYAILAGLRGSVSTGRGTFKFEYTSNLTANDEAWNNLIEKRNQLTVNQKVQLNDMEVARLQFFELPDQMFALASGEHAREDLYLFRVEAVPLAENMQLLLSEITLDQEHLLESDLNAGREELRSSQQRNLLIGLVALVLAIGLAVVIRDNIVGPIQRLTQVAERISAGELNARVEINSRDEIGILATGFNKMTSQLRDTLDDLDTRRREQEAIAETLKHQNGYFSALHETTLRLMSRLDLEDLLEDLMARVGQILNAPHGYIYLLMPNETPPILELRVGTGIFREQFGNRLDAGVGLAGKVWQSGNPAVIVDYDAWEGRSPTFGYNLIGTIAAVPLVRATSQSTTISESIGVLGIAYDIHSANTFGDNELQLLRRFAELASIAIDNARLFEEAEHARRAAEAADQSKGDFLSSVSHELRTPLTSVLGFARIIQKELDTRVFPAIESDDRKVKRAVTGVAEDLAIIIQEGERLTTLINNVLDLAKIEAGKIEWHMEMLTIADVIDRATSATSALFTQKNITLVKELAPNLPMVLADQDKLIQVVINLLSNAVKFTDQGSVTCRAQVQENKLIVSITDTGVGIAPEDQPKVFEKFKQVGDTLTNKPKGTGLGLPICKEIIEHHGGQIWVESTLGQGSTFAFSLPLAATDSALASHPLDLATLTEQLKAHISQNRLPHLQQTVLVVDDSLSIRTLLRKELEAAGYVVREAADGTQALVMVQKERPDLIILDIMMPGINGFDVAAALKHNPTTMDLPIIILSIVEDKERGYRLGVERYLNKPTNTATLLQEVNQLLNPDPANQHVLIADKDKAVMETLGQVLQEKGYQVDLVVDQAALLERAGTTKPQLIIMNEAFSAQRGLLAQVRQQTGLQNTLILFYQIKD